MTTQNQILNVTVGEPLRAAGARAAATMCAIARGEKVQPQFGVNFELNVPWSEIVVDMKLPEQAAA